MKKDYLICGTPRSGTTYLQGLLQSTHVAGYPEEAVITPLTKTLYGVSGFDPMIDNIAAFRRVCTSSNGVFGTQIMDPRSIPDRLRIESGFEGTDAEVWSQVLNDPAYVWMRRRDTIAHAVSVAILYLTRFPYIERSDRDKLESALDYDCEAIKIAEQGVIDQNRLWGDWFRESGIEPLQVWYEDVLEDSAKAAASVLEFLGIDPTTASPIQALTEKQAGELSVDWIERYRRDTGRP